MTSIISAVLLWLLGSICLTTRLWPIGILFYLAATILVIGLLTLCGPGPLSHCAIM